MKTLPLILFASLILSSAAASAQGGTGAAPPIGTPPKGFACPMNAVCAPLPTPHPLPPPPRFKCPSGAMCWPLPVRLPN